MSEEVRKIKTIGAEQEIKTLSEISTLVQSSPVEMNSFEEVLTKLGEIIDFRSASLYAFSKETGKLDEICTVGRRVDLIDFVNFEMGNGISAWVAKHGRPIVLNNLRKSKGGTHTKSFLSVPIVFAKEIAGVINLAHDEPDSFSKRDAEIVSIAASVMALLLERIIHERALSEKASRISNLEQEIEKAKHQTVKQDLLPVGLEASLYQKISNPLAIISGNAQFLIMTLKNANPSVLKRLRAIDKEAGSIAAVSQHLKDVSGSSIPGILLKREPEPAQPVLS